MILNNLEARREGDGDEVGALRERTPGNAGRPLGYVDVAVGVRPDEAGGLGAGQEEQRKDELAAP